MEKPGLRDVSSVFQGHDAYAGATSGFETFNLLTPAFMLLVASLTGLRIMASSKVPSKSHTWLTWGPDHRDSE